MKRWCLAACVVFLAAGDALAQGYSAGHSGQGWSVLSAQTVGSGDTVLQVEAGWPGIPVTLLHGVAPNVDLGGRFSLNYGYEGEVDNTFVGLKLQGIARFKLVDAGRVKFGMSVEPGPLFYFPNPNFAIVGMAIPVNFVFGFNVTSNFIANAGFDLPMWFTFTDYSSFNFSLGIGGGFEYFIDSHLALTFNLRMGPVIASDYTFGHTSFAVQKALFGVAIHL